MFSVSEKTSFIADPLLFDGVEIPEIKGSAENARIEAVYLTIAVELAVKPMTLIGKTAVRIVQPTVAMHLVVLPLTFVPTSLREVTLSIALLFAVNFITFVNCLEIQGS